MTIVTDSGMPCISDPGSRVIQICRESNIPISVIPGPTALTSAISLAGCSESGFVFHGFLPHKEVGRKKIIEKYKNYSVPIIFYESPYRLLKLLKQVCEVLGEKAFVYVFREVTKNLKKLLKERHKRF